MSVVLAVLLCRLFVTCAGVPAGILSKGVCLVELGRYRFLLKHPCRMPLERWSATSSDECAVES